VEDHGVIAKMIKIVLEERGDRIDMATALALADSQSLDVLLGLPDGSGHMFADTSSRPSHSAGTGRRKIYEALNQAGIPRSNRGNNGSVVIREIKQAEEKLCKSALPSVRTWSIAEPRLDGDASAAKPIVYPQQPKQHLAKHVLLEMRGQSRSITLDRPR
jgi:hypothetical protein